MTPTMNDIINIVAAPPNLRAVFTDTTTGKDYCEPVAAIAHIGIDNGLGDQERDVVALVANDLGITFATEFDNFNRLEWSVQRSCKCSTPAP